MKISIENLSAFIFDMDGVIVDSEKQWLLQEGDLIKTYIPDWGPEDYHRITGLGVEELYNLLVNEYGFEMSFEEFSSMNEKIAHEIYKSKVNLTPGFSELLEKLISTNLPLAIASSSPMRWIEIVLDRFDLASSFNQVVSADHVGGKGKPAPDIYLHTAKELDVDAKKCLVVEDSRHGVHAACDARMTVLGFRNGYNEGQDLERAHHLIHGLREIEVILGIQ